MRRRCGIASGNEQGRLLPLVHPSDGLHRSDLALMAIPDGAHRHERDFLIVPFNLPHVPTPLYALSCFRQVLFFLLPSSSLSTVSCSPSSSSLHAPQVPQSQVLDQRSEITRSMVQKAVVLLLRQCIPSLRAPLEATVQVLSPSSSSSHHLFSSISFFSSHH